MSPTTCRVTGPRLPSPFCVPATSAWWRRGRWTPPHAFRMSRACCRSGNLPAICSLLQQVTVIPDLLICDGQGIAHPRRFGLACHLGVMFDVPTIGCAKTRLLGTGCEPGMARGDSAVLLDRGEPVGCVLRTCSGVRPVYVSPGHRISVASACEWVLRLAPRFRLPQPLRLADQAARRALAQSPSR